MKNNKAQIQVSIDTDSTKNEVGKEKATLRCKQSLKSVPVKKLNSARDLSAFFED